MDKLNEKTDKDSRINFTKIIEYVNALQLHGKALGMPYIKHLTGEIWELRPLKNRILFFGYDGNNFVLLSHFIKKTKKTPKREIEKATKHLNNEMDEAAEKFYKTKKDKEKDDDLSL